jgi:hypothetical protein
MGTKDRCGVKAESELQSEGSDPSIAISPETISMSRHAQPPCWDFAETFSRHACSEQNRAKQEQSRAEQSRAEQSRTEQNRQAEEEDISIDR